MTRLGKPMAPVVGALLAVALASMPVPAQGPAWLLQQPPQSPAARAFHAMVATDAGALLFGGFGGPLGFPSVPLADTWRWQADAWQPLPVTGPSPRDSMAMVWDAARQRAVLFGGLNGTTYLGDTWEWDGAAWTQVATLTAPSPRGRHAMAYDSVRQRTVLYGGTVAGGQAVGDTWEWDGSTWTVRVSAHAPGLRLRHAMAFDPLRGRTVLAGGTDQVVTWLGDVWEWDGTDWLARGVVFPPRAASAMAWDAARQCVVMVGGYGLPAIGLNQHADVWTWDGSSAAQRNTSAQPVGRLGHAIAWDGARQGVVLFGGVVLLTHVGDTWALGRTAASATTYGNGCGSPPLALVPVPSARPILGQTARAGIANAPGGLVAIALGWSDQLLGALPLPLSLTAAGLTNCSLWHSADVLGLGAAPVAGGFEFAQALPNSTSLLDRHVFVQAVAFAAGQNPAALITSNGLDWRLGDV